MLSVAISSNALELWKNIVYNEWRLTIAESCIFILEDIYSSRAADALVEAGFDYVKNLEDPEAYAKQLERVRNETSAVIVRLNQYRTQYEKSFPEAAQQAVVKRTELDYDKELAVLARHGYRLDKRTQSVTEYCAAVNAFFEEVKKSKKNGR